MQEQEKFDCWAIVEVMGHSRYAGRVTEQAIGGCNFVRVDIPEVEGRPAFTKLLGQASIFGITPVTEEIARGLAAQYRNAPVSVYDLPSLRPAALTVDAAASDDEDYDDEQDSELF